MPNQFHEAGVYIIRHRRDGRAYIGASCQLTARLNQHRDYMLSGDWPVGGWVRVKNVADWEFVILERVEVSASEPKRGGGPGVRHLREREKHWIKKLKPSFNPQPREPMSIAGLKVGEPIGLVAAGSK